MKKVRCPRCGVINLDKFITYPYCAGCGALLPQAPETTVIPLWRRPLKPFLWVTIIGCAILGLIATTTSFNSTSMEPGHIIIYGRMPRKIPVGSTLKLHLIVDTIESPTSHDQMLNDVKLRLSGSWLKKFNLVTLKPQPNEITLGGSGRYFHYNALSRNTPLELTVRALQPGHHQLKAVIYAQQQYPGEFRTSINVVGNTKSVDPKVADPKVGDTKKVSRSIVYSGVKTDNKGFK